MTHTLLLLPYHARLFSLFLTAFLCLSAPLPLAAQKFQPKSILFKGDSEFSDAELMAAAGLKKGVVLTVAEMKDHFDRLTNTGVFETISYKFDGVDLIYTLTPGDLYPIRLANLPLTPGKELDAKLHESLPLYHGKVPLAGGLLEDVRGALQDMLASQGIKATVAATQYTDQKLKKVTAMSFAIASPPVEVGEIGLDGASPALAPKGQEILTKLTGSAYGVDDSPNQVMDKLGDFYRDKGYLEVDVKATPQTAVISPSGAIRVPFIVTVSPGALYKVSGIQLAPGLIVTQGEFDHQSHIHSGDLADSEHIRENWHFIERQYHNKGYMMAKIEPAPNFNREQAMATYLVSVEPGPVYTMGKLTVGNVSED